ncbi:MAG TPA: GNAT family N-acetyltransferase [Saprospiraceae bacterium]|nr:GNAT family N-acetyltransferase [Saprospiraceae bacterium]HMQ83628.1 GNAT family N-acetyltransferase [Saprospiraceae bacterium]
MKKAIDIRKGQLEDLPHIHELVRELAIYERSEAAFTATLEDYQRDFQEGIFETIVAEVDDGVVGMVLFYMTYSTWKGKMLYLEDFVIKEAWRKQGIGQLLFDAFLEEAKYQKCRLVKWQVLDWNQPAIDFYEKNQAIIEKDWWNGKLFLNT